MRYRLSTLMFLMAVGPPALAVAWLLCRLWFANPYPFEPVLTGVFMYCFVAAVVYRLHSSA